MPAEVAGLGGDSAPAKHKHVLPPPSPSPSVMGMVAVVVAMARTMAIVEGMMAKGMWLTCECIEINPLGGRK